MKRLDKVILGIGSMTVLGLLGCSDVSYDDVQSARENVHEEERETAETRKEVAQDIAEEEAETAAAIRHEAMKPIVSEDVRDEFEETEEVREEGAAAIAEEEKETREARNELEETRKRLSAQQSRDRYVKEVEATVARADRRIEQLEKLASEQEEPAKAETEDQVNELKTRRNRVQEHLGELQGKELLKWEEHRDEVQRALEDLTGELDESR